MTMRPFSESPGLGGRGHWLSSSGRRGEFRSGGFDGKEIPVVLFGSAPERGADIRRERQIVLQAIRQVRVRREMAAEGDKVCIAGSHDRLGAVALEAAGRDDRAGEVRLGHGGDADITAQPKSDALDAGLL